MNLLQRTLATVSAMGTAALMTLPVLAQSTPLNNGTNSSTVDCSYITGGIGGPVDNQASGNQTSPSSYDTASSGVQGNTSVPLGNNTGNSVNNQTSGNQASTNQTSTNQTSTNQASGNQTSPSSYDTASSGVQGNTSVPSGNASAPNTNSNVNRFPSEGNINQNSTNPSAPNTNSNVNQPNQGNINQRQSADRLGATTYHAMMQVTRSPEFRQFDANNASAAVAFRSNGPAGTAGHEAKMNLNAFQEGQDALRERNLSASTPLPIACAPRSR